ncbi:MAG: CHAP domain-containing protein [Nakamurella sp.]
MRSGARTSSPLTTISRTRTPLRAVRDAARGRLALVGVLVATATIGTGVTAASASAAAPGVSYLCSSGDYGCLASTGYGGQSVWGSWGPGHNCVSYASFRLEQAGAARPWPDRVGSGFEWDDKARAAGVPVDDNPAVGAIAQWDNYGAGHVGYVEAVTDSYIDVSEDNYSSRGSGTSTVRRIERSSQMFADASFIHVRDAVAAAPPNRVSDGTVGDNAVVDYQGHVYRIAGGAPVYTSTFDAVGGPQPTISLSDAEFGALRSVPREGTVLVGSQRGEVYRVTGGAPVYVSTWDAIGGPQAPIWVDQAALDNAGAGGVWDHLSRRPVDGTTVVVWPNGEVYRFAGGAPIYVASFDAISFWGPMLSVDVAAIDRADGGGAWSHVAMRPAEGTVIAGGQTGRVYVIGNGHPEYVSDWAQIGGPRPATVVDQVAIDNAGGPDRWRHLG